MKTYYYNKGFYDGAVIDISGERRKALLDAVEGTMSECYGEKKTYADGVMRYPWERQPYEAIIRQIKELPDTAETINIFGGFYGITKFSLKHFASRNALCEEMLYAIEQAEKDTNMVKL